MPQYYSSSSSTASVCLWESVESGDEEIYRAMRAERRHREPFRATDGVVEALSILPVSDSEL